MKKNFVIALGGSIAFPKEIDVGFLKKLKVFLIEEIKKGNKFIIIIGGGAVCREYNKMASLISDVSDVDKDWIGIKTTRLNAEFLRAIFKSYAHPLVLDQRMKVKSFEDYSLILGCGWEPGHSTDFDAVQTALDFNIDNIIIMGKPDYVYTKDPEKDKTAEKIEKMTWADYLKLIPKEWIPGFSSPVDVTASLLAKENNLKVIVCNGDLDNFKNILQGRDFKGTTIVN